MSDSEAEVEQVVNADEDGGNTQPEILVLTAKELEGVEKGRSPYDDEMTFQSPYDDGNTKWMKFEVKVTSKDQSHVGHNVGLVQNVISSSRVSTFGTADNAVGTLTTLPSSGDFPLLDGDVDEKPWYNESVKGQPLPDVGNFITLSFSDAPGTTVPVAANQNGVNGTIELVSTEVSEVFIIYLYDEDSKTTLKKWKWSYSFSYDNESKQLVNFDSEPPAETEEGSQLPVLEDFEGFTAGGKLLHKWTNGWSANGF